MGSDVRYSWILASKKRVYTIYLENQSNNNNNIQFLETHNTIKNSLYACEKSKYQKVRGSHCKILEDSL